MPPEKDQKLILLKSTLTEIKLSESQVPKKREANTTTIY